MLKSRRFYGILNAIRRDINTSKRKFTEAEIAVLAANPYTFQVTPNRISFTLEFKQLFWSKYQKRESSIKIFRECGYDPAILGRGRIIGFGQSLKKDVEAGLTFCEGQRPSGTRRRLADADNPYSTQMREVLRRLDFLEQEMAFLKKISSLRTSRK